MERLCYAGLQIVHAFGLSAGRAFGYGAAQMARTDDRRALEQLLRDISGILSDQEHDAVLPFFET